MCKGKRISEPICNVLKKFESIRTGDKRKISFEIVLKKEKKSNTLDLTLSYIMLKNGQRTLKVCLAIFQHYARKC